MKVLISILLLVSVVATSISLAVVGFDNYTDKQKKCELEFPNEKLKWYTNNWVLYYPEDDYCCHYDLIGEHIGRRCNRLE